MSYLNRSSLQSALPVIHLPQLRKSPTLMIISIAGARKMHTTGNAVPDNMLTPNQSALNRVLLYSSKQESWNHVSATTF